MKNSASLEVTGWPSDHFQFLYLIVTVLSPLLHDRVGGQAHRLVLGLAEDPFGNQFVGRHIWYWNE